MSCECEEDNSPEEITAPGWMATYGDLMSLLLVFFILLVSFSTMEVVKFRKAMGSLQGGQGFLDPETGNSVIKKSINTSDADFLEAVEQMVAELESEELDDQISVFWDSNGVRFVLQNQVLFSPGTADLKPQFYQIIDAVLKVLETYSVEEIRIEGHTDNTPMHSQRYPSNWELSVDRATQVLRYIEKKKIYEARRLVAVGFGEFRSTVPNDSPANKAKNRRVELYVARKKTSN